MSLEGQQLGRYRLLKLIGSGGMGEVYLAQDQGFKRLVAIKVVRTGMATHSGAESSMEAIRLFQRETKTIAMLDHPGILPLYDYGEQNVNGAMLTYLVMPYCEEGSLTNWLQKGGRALLSLQGVEQMVQQAAAALQYAHDHQVVHQDVKPSNFLIRSGMSNPKRPDLLLADFGIAKLSMFVSSTSLSIRGTPTYMAPEQWEGHPVPATDQYALAVMIYELLTGRAPFQGSPMQLMYAHVNTQPVAPSHLNPRLSTAIDAVILRGLAKRAEERFPSIIAFAFAFRQALRRIDSSMTMGTASPDTSTLIKTTNTTGGGDSYATLAISEEEVRSGTNRILTLPGGRRVRIRIPAGIRDGQIMSVKDQSEVTTGGSSTSRVHFTLSITHTAPHPSLPGDGEKVITQGDVTAMTAGEKASVNNDSTAATTEDKLAARNDAVIPSNQDGSRPADASPLDAAPATKAATSESGTVQASRGRVITDRRRKLSEGSVVLLAALVLLLLVSSGGLFFYFGGRHATPPESGVKATATDRAHVAETATARVSGTVNTQRSATATAIAANSNPYPPYRGRLVLSDPLSENNGGHQWQVFSDSATGMSCQFMDGAYHMVEAPNNKGVCFATATDFSNFTYQMQMVFLRAGQSYDGGGMVIRRNGNNFYYFELYESGRYVFSTCMANDCSNILAQGLAQGTPAFHAGVNQPNTIAIVANGNSFDLYVNGQHVAGAVSDGNFTSSHGMIGVYGEGTDATTEVVYSDVKVWA
jgi:eukaryotic-like serine/threonine-protein kinase